MIGRHKFLAAFSAVVSLFGMLTVAATGAAHAQEWRPLGGGLRNVSGMALVENGATGTTVLVVHDNKKESEPRIGLVAIPADKDGPVVYTALPWPAGSPLPIDLEALCAMPGTPGEYVALASGGTAYHVRLDAAAKSLTLVRSFDLPKGPEGSNYEGFTLYRTPSALFAVWAHRGSGTSDAVLSWAPLDLATGKIGSPVKTLSFRTPWPVADSRPVSDLKIDTAGEMFVSSASDPGDDGPFTSALYLVGAFRSPSSAVAGSSPLEFSLNPAPVRLYRSVHHKVEGFEIVPGPDGGIIFGTDDESLGASVWRNWD